MSKATKQTHDQTPPKPPRRFSQQPLFGLFQPLVAPLGFCGRVRACDWVWVTQSVGGDESCKGQAAAAAAVAEEGEGEGEEEEEEGGGGGCGEMSCRMHGRLRHRCFRRDTPKPPQKQARARAQSRRSLFADLLRWAVVQEGATVTRRTSLTSSLVIAVVSPTPSFVSTIAARRRAMLILSPSACICCATRRSSFPPRPSRPLALPPTST